MVIKKKYISLFILIIFTGMLVGCESISSDSSQELKGELYKYDIEELDYSIFKTKFYEIHYTTDTGATGESHYILNKDGTCIYTHVLKSSSGNISMTSKECSYSIDNETLNVSMTVNRVINSYGGNENYTEPLEVTGSFYDNYKYLKIGELQYSSQHYNIYLEEYMSYVLIDPETTNDYKLDGTSMGNSENSIDVSQYKIIDKTNE